MGIRCYLFYGLSAHQNKTRFFAEYLTTFIPRLFVKKQSLNSAQRLKKIFADAFKHGFCANLSGDEKFEKYYKVITKYTHISNNYKDVQNFLNESINPDSVRLIDSR